MNDKVVITEKRPYLIRINSGFIKQMILSIGSSISAFSQTVVFDEKCTPERNKSRFYGWLQNGKMPVLKVLATAKHLMVKPEDIVLDEDIERLHDRVDRMQRFKTLITRHNLGMVSIEEMVAELDQTLPYFMKPCGTEWYDKDGNLLASHDRWLFHKNKRTMERNYGEEARIPTGS